MSYASDALLKETASRVAQIEKLMAEFRAKVDELNARLDIADGQRVNRSNRRTPEAERI